MSKEKLMELEYRDDQKYKKLNPTCKQIREVTYMQNNPQNKNFVTATSMPSDNEEEIKRKER